MGAFKDFMNRMRQGKEREPGPLRVYLHRADGQYNAGWVVKTGDEFRQVFPQIADHIDRKGEVTIGKEDDQLIFHSKDGRTTYDGMGLQDSLDQRKQHRE